MRCYAILLLAALFGGYADAALAASCAETIGAAKAGQLVDECLDASPATHPPCNAKNSCDLIISEIKRGCALAQNQMAYCKNYK